MWGQSTTMEETHQDEHKKYTPTMFKTVLLICGLCGFVITWSEVDSYVTFQEQYSKACNLDLSFVNNLLVQYIYKSITIFVILTRKYTWYPYIVAYLILLCEIVVDSKKVMILWLLISALRSLFINIVVVLTGLWFSLTMNRNIWFILDFVLFKILQIGISGSFWYVLWTLYRTPETTGVAEFNNGSQAAMQLTKKRRASFNGFGWHDHLSGISSMHSTMIDTTLSDDLNEPARDSDYAFLSAVHRSRSLHSLVNKNMADWFAMEANAIDDDSVQSSFSFNLATRAAEYANNFIDNFITKAGQLTPEELTTANKLKITETAEEIHINVLPRLPPLLIVNSFIDLLNDPSEVELKTIEIMSASKEESSQIALMNQDKCPLTLDELYSIFYKQK